MTQLRIDFQWRGEVETCSWAWVQVMGDDIQLARRVARHVGALGQVLAQQPIRVFVGATLPRAVRIPGSRAAVPDARAQPSLSPDSRSRFCAAVRAQVGVSW